MFDISTSPYVARSKKGEIITFFMGYLEVLRKDPNEYTRLKEEKSLFILNTNKIVIRTEEIIGRNKHTAVVRAKYENGGAMAMYLSLENNKWRITRTRITSYGKAVPAADTVRGSL